VTPELESGLRERLRRLVRERLGVVVGQARDPQLDAAIASAVVSLALSGPEELARRLAAGGEAARVAADALAPSLTINETHFFRNLPQLDALRGHVLPRLLSERAERRSLSVWSAACSSGEEPYTVAILLDQLLSGRESWALDILGTDLDRDVLARARAGRYRKWSFRGVPDAVRERWFTAEPGGKEWQIEPSLATRVRFAQNNLIENAPPRSVSGGKFDLILCRNVLIYFDDETVGRVLERLHQALSPGGWLVVGHAEPGHRAFSAFETQSFKGTVLYRRQDQRSASSAPASAPQRLAPNPVAPLRLAPDPVAPATAASSLLEQARAAAALRRRGDAERLVRAAIAQSGEDAAAHHLHGVIFHQAGRIDDAIEALRRAVYLDEGLIVARIALAGLLAGRGSTTRAERELARAEELLAPLAPPMSLAGADGLTVAAARGAITLARRHGAERLAAQTAA